MPNGRMRSTLVSAHRRRAAIYAISQRHAAAPEAPKPTIEPDGTLRIPFPDIPDDSAEADDETLNLLRRAFTAQQNLPARPKIGVPPAAGPQNASNSAAPAAPISFPNAPAPRPQKRIGVIPGTAAEPPTIDPAIIESMRARVAALLAAEAPPEVAET